MACSRSVLVLILLLSCGCSLAPDPQLVYDHDAPDLNVPEDHPVPELHPGDQAFVALASGEHFEARYRGFSEGFLEFAEVEWDEALGREPEATRKVALGEVAEIRRRDWGTTDAVVAWSSLAALLVIVGVYGYGDG